MRTTLDDTHKDYRHLRIDVEADFEDYDSARMQHAEVAADITEATTDLVKAMDQAGDVTIVGHDPWVLALVNSVLKARGLKVVPVRPT